MGNIPSDRSDTVREAVWSQPYVAPSPSMIFKCTDEDIACVMADGTGRTKFSPDGTCEMHFQVRSKGLRDTSDPLPRMIFGVARILDLTAHNPIRRDESDRHRTFKSQHLVGIGSRDGRTMSFFNGQEPVHLGDSDTSAFEKSVKVTVRVAEYKLTFLIDGRPMAHMGHSIDHADAMVFAVACLDMGQSVDIIPSQPDEKTVLSRLNDLHRMLKNPTLPNLPVKLPVKFTQPASLSFYSRRQTSVSITVDTSGKIALCHAAPRSAEGATLVTNEYLPTDASWTAEVHLNPNKAFLPASSGTVYVGIIGFHQPTDMCPFLVHHVGHKAYNGTTAIAIAITGDTVSLISGGENKFPAVQIWGAQFSVLTFRHTSETGMTVRVTVEGTSVDCFPKFNALFPKYLTKPKFFRIAVTLSQPGQNAFIGSHTECDRLMEHDSARAVFTEHAFLACRKVTFPNEEVASAEAPLNNPLRVDVDAPRPTAPAADIQRYMQDHTYVAPTSSLLMKLSNEDCAYAIMGAFEATSVTEASFAVVSNGVYDGSARMTCGIVLERNATAHRIRRDDSDSHLLFPSYDMIGFGSRDGATMGVFDGPARCCYAHNECDRLDTGAVVTIRVCNGRINAAVNGKRVVCAGLDSIVLDADQRYLFAVACFDAGQAVAVGNESTLAGTARESAGWVSAFQAVLKRPCVPSVKAIGLAPQASLSFGLLAPTSVSVAVDASGKIACCRATPRSAEGATLVTNEYLPTDASWTVVVRLNPNRAFLPASADLGTMYVGLIGFPKDTDRCPYSLHHVGHEAFDDTPSFAIQLAGDALSLISAGEVKWTALPPQIPGASSGAVAFRYESNTGAITVRVSGSDGEAVDCFRQLPKLAFLPTPRYWRLAVTFCKPGQSAFIGTDDQWDDCVNHDSCWELFESLHNIGATEAYFRETRPADGAVTGPATMPVPSLVMTPHTRAWCSPHFFPDAQRAMQVNSGGNVVCVVNNDEATIVSKETVPLDTTGGPADWTAQFSIVAVNGEPLDSPQSTAMSGPMYFGIVGEQPAETWCRSLGDPAMGAPSLGVRFDGGEVTAVGDGRLIRGSESSLPCFHGADGPTATSRSSLGVSLQPGDTVSVRIASRRASISVERTVAQSDGDMPIDIPIEFIVPQEVNRIRFAVTLTSVGQCVALRSVPLHEAAEFRVSRCAARLPTMIAPVIARSRLDAPRVQWTFEGHGLSSTDTRSRTVKNELIGATTCVTRQCFKTSTGRAGLGLRCACNAEHFVGAAFHASVGPITLCEDCFDADETFVRQKKQRVFRGISGGSVFDFSIRIQNLVDSSLTIGLLPAAVDVSGQIIPGRYADSAGLEVSANKVTVFWSNTECPLECPHAPRVAQSDVITVRVRGESVVFALNHRVLCQRDGFSACYRFAIHFATKDQEVVVLPSPYVAVPQGSIQRIEAEPEKIKFERRLCDPLFAEHPDANPLVNGQYYRVLHVEYNEMIVWATRVDPKRVDSDKRTLWTYNPIRIPIAILQRVAYHTDGRPIGAWQMLYGRADSLPCLILRKGERVWPHAAHWRGGAELLDTPGVVVSVDAAARTCDVEFSVTDPNLRTEGREVTVHCRFGRDGFFDVLPTLEQGDSVVRCPTGWVDSQDVGHIGTVSHVNLDRTVQVTWASGANLLHAAGKQRLHEVQRWASAEPPSRVPAPRPAPEPERLLPINMDEFDRSDEKIGDGGFSIVFKWYWSSRNMFVAVKKLLRGNAEKELGIMLKLRHVNIVTTYGWTRDRDSLFIIMELVQPPPSDSESGVTLKDYLQLKATRGSGTPSPATGGPLGWNDFFNIVIAVAEALAYIHDQRCFHRDIKPANILLDRVSCPGRIIAKVSDFGLSAILPEGHSTATASSNFAGTYEYAPPEAFNGEEMGHRSDIYAMGVVMWEMLTGNKPRKECRCYLDFVLTVGQEERALPRIEGCPPLIRDLVDRCTKKERDQRIKSRDLFNELTRLRTIIAPLL